MINNPPPEFFVKAVWLLSSILLLLIIYYLINIGNNYIPERKRIKINNSKILPILGILLALYFFKGLLNRYAIISDTFFTIIVSIILAYLFNPMVNYLERKGMNRLHAVIMIYFIILGVFFILAFLVIPKSGREIRRLIENLPIYFSNISRFIDDLYRKYYSTIGDLPPMFQGVDSIIIQNISRLENVIVTSLTNFVAGVINTFSKIISLILTPILTLYFLVDKDYFNEKAKNIVPRKYKSDVLKLTYEIDLSITQFIRGRLIMALFVGFATTIILLLMDVDFALVIGFITGIADIIPYIGPFLGFLPAVIFAYMSSPIKAVWISIIFVLIQWVENNVIAPKVIGDTTGIHPLVILLTIIIGGAIFGVWGMVISVPLVAISRILIIFTIEKIRLRKKDLS